MSDEAYIEGGEDSLALWFTPDAIRDHFDGDPDDPTIGMTDAELVAVGLDALRMDALYEAFHRCLVDAMPDRKEKTHGLDVHSS